MKANLGALRLAIGLVASLSVCGPASRRNRGAFCDCLLWTVRRACRSSKKSTIAVLGPMMGVPSDHLLFPRRNLLEPYVKGLTLMVNGIFNGNCREDIWLDK